MTAGAKQRWTRRRNDEIEWKMWKQKTRNEEKWFLFGWKAKMRETMCWCFVQLREKSVLTGKRKIEKRSSHSRWTHMEVVCSRVFSFFLFCCCHFFFFFLFSQTIWITNRIKVHFYFVCVSFHTVRSVAQKENAGIL